MTEKEEKAGLKGKVSKEAGDTFRFCSIKTNWHQKLINEVHK